MTPQMIDNIFALAAGTFRLLSVAFKKKGLDKLASELEATAARTDAFRSDPVFKQEIDAIRLPSTW